MSKANQTSGTKRFVLPRCFWVDHFERCSEHPGERVVVKETANRVTVDLDGAAFDNLLSDAQHYADDGVDAADMRRICRSARATLRALATPTH